nr:NAD(+)/NADH kinase [Neisseriaceae bacterium]
PSLHPTLPAMTMVPICPQSMNNRPIAIPDTCKVEVLLTKGIDTRIHFDGQSLYDLDELDRIFIQRYQNSLRILHPLDYNYYGTLRQKLHWGERLV